MSEHISKRLAALRALTTHLSDEIRIENGYKHDLSNAVFRGRLAFATGDDDNPGDPLPMVSILENPNPDRFPQRAGYEDQGDSVQRDKWTLNVQGWVEDDPLNPTDPAYELMADVKKALYALIAQHHPEQGIGGIHPNYCLDGLINGLEFEAGTVRPPDELSSKAFFWMRVILDFAENVKDPYDHG